MCLTGLRRSSRPSSSFGLRGPLRFEFAAIHEDADRTLGRRRSVQQARGPRATYRPRYWARQLVQRGGHMPCGACRSRREQGDGDAALTWF
jgi:hypothetical protein